MAMSILNCIEDYYLLSESFKLSLKKYVFIIVVPQISSFKYKHS